MDRIYHLTQISYSIGFLVTYFTVQYWFPLAIVSLAAHGIGFSFVYATAIGAAQKWFPKHRKGLVGSIVVSGYGFGSIFWVPIQTTFVNPNNVQAEIDHECEYIGTDLESSKCDKYFLDENMLARIPYMFLLLGGIFSIMGMIATLLISEPDDEKLQSFKEDDKAIEMSKKPDNKSSSVFSLTPVQVLKTPIFYQVLFQVGHLICVDFFPSRYGLASSAFVSPTD